jgi:hypothetical protein
MTRSELCEAQIPGVCLGRIQNGHHRDPRGEGGTKIKETAATYLAVCGSGTTGCHGWIEQHRYAAGIRGWLVFMGETCEDKPCLVHGRWIRLRPDGGTEPVEDTLALLLTAELSVVGG